MKRFLVLLISIFMLMNLEVFATEQYIEYQSGEQDDGATYINSYEDYMNIMGDMDTQEIYKEEYENMVAQARAIFETSFGVDLVKARVLSVENTVEEYSYDDYGPCKIRYQPITVQILEGEHKGETYDVIYILTADTYENLKIKEVRVNQKINVMIDEEYGEAYATTVDASVNRIGAIIGLVVITIIFMLIYLGKKAFKALPQIILIADIILLIFVPELLGGRSILWLTIITSLLYMIVESAIKVGLNTKMVASIVSSIAVTLVTTLCMMLFSSSINYSGITYEITNMLEAFPMGTIDFYMLYISSFILMCVIVISDISCKTVNLYAEEVEKNAKVKIKDYVSEKIPQIFGILLVMVIPKYLYTLIAKYTFDEIVNSEMLTTDIVRILFLIIASTLTIQVATYAKKLFVVDERKALPKKEKN